MNCIICDESIQKNSVEHIIPESLGNTVYFLEANTLCQTCNNRFSEFEDKAITRSFLSLIRMQNAIKTKKGKPSTLKVGDFQASGNTEFKKDIISLDKIEEHHITNKNPKTGAFDITISDFDNTEMSASKMLLKIGFESLYKSQKKVFTKYDFTELKDHLTNRNTKDWPFITAHKPHYTFKSIPTFNDKHNLNKIKCYLKYLELSENVMLFEFQYDYYNMTINLLSRDFVWSAPYFKIDTSASLYPKYLKKP